MSRARSNAPLDVVIVSDNPETLDGLQRYLRDAGVAPRCTRDVTACVDIAPPGTVAFVIFPDDFPWEQTIVTLAALSERRPRALPVLVTSRPDRYESVTASRVLLIPRPVWGWTILDAIQGRLEEQVSPPPRRKGSHRP